MRGVTYPFHDTELRGAQRFLGAGSSAFRRPKGAGGIVRYKVVVTKVEVAERWVRATDEEHAAAKVKDELTSPWAYAGKWETVATELAVVDAEPEATNLENGSPSATETLLLNLKDAANELGISYGTLRTLMNRGDIGFTQVGSRKRISRESLAQFVRSNTHPGSAGA